MTNSRKKRIAKALGEDLASQEETWDEVEEYRKRNPKLWEILKYVSDKVPGMGLEMAAHILVMEGDDVSRRLAQHWPQIYQQIQLCREAMAQGDQEPEESTRPDIPEVLNTEQAQRLWTICQAKGWVDEQLQPMQSMYRTSILASVIGGLLGLDPLWRPFEQLWDTKGLSTTFAKAQLTNYYESAHKTMVRALQPSE